MCKSLKVLLCAFVLGTGAYGWAAPLTFDFGNSPSGPVGASSWAVTQGAYTLTAWGLNANNTAHLLYWKNAGPDEHGLGLVGTLDNELTLASGGTAIANYIQIDVSQVYLLSPTGEIRIQSVTSGEKFNLYGSSTPGSIGTPILSGSTADNVFISIPNWGTYPYISVSVTPLGAAHASDNVLMDAMMVTPTPEPASLMLLAAGGLVWSRRRGA
jgi:hypothetical protein